jgi:hypothetical protein
MAVLAAAFFSGFVSCFIYTGVLLAAAFMWGFC